MHSLCGEYTHTNCTQTAYVRQWLPLRWRPRRQHCGEFNSIQLTCQNYARSVLCALPSCSPTLTCVRALKYERARAIESVKSTAQRQATLCVSHIRTRMERGASVECSEIMGKCAVYVCCIFCCGACRMHMHERVYLRVRRRLDAYPLTLSTRTRARKFSGKTYTALRQQLDSEPALCFGYGSVPTRATEM